MRTFSKVFNIISGIILIILACIMGINRQNMGVAISIIIFGLILVVWWEWVSSNLEFDNVINVAILVTWVAILLISTLACCSTFKDREVYDKTIDAYNNGRYEEALDGFMKLEGMYDADDYLENVVRLKGTDVEVVK